MATSSTGRNWALVILASLVIVGNTILVIACALNFEQLGWWAALLIAGGLLSIALAIVAIIENDPTWLLLDLILPN